MTTTISPPTESTSRPRLGRGAAFTLIAVIIATFLGASATPTPLYEHYQQLWGFSSLASTLVFGIYALALLATLLTAGSLSDHIGSARSCSERSPWRRSRSPCSPRPMV